MPLSWLLIVASLGLAPAEARSSRDDIKMKFAACPEVRPEGVRGRGRRLEDRGREPEEGRG